MYLGMMKFLGLLNGGTVQPDNGRQLPLRSIFRKKDDVKVVLQLAGGCIFSLAAFRWIGAIRSIAPTSITMIFVITEQAPERKPKENGSISFTFVSIVEAVIRQAKQAAGEKDVTVVGGPNVGLQFVKGRSRG